jgi:Cfr10I/Bse634I restriction endonuclease
MPFTFADQTATCTACQAAGTACILDTRINRIRNRNTDFRIVQNRTIDCALEEFTPGTDADPDPSRPFSYYMTQVAANTAQAGRVIYGDDFTLTVQQIAKVGGDGYELVEAAALWNAIAVWNGFMDSGIWTSTAFTKPADAIATPTRKVAVIQLPRGYDATRLFNERTRRDYLAFQAALERSGMELRLSSPDIVGVRIPEPMPPGFAPFMKPLPNLKDANRHLLETAHEAITGTLDARSFLFAIAVKTSTRSDRLYQPLFEANVLKFLIGYVLHGGAFRFHVHMGTFEGAAVENRYKAASLTALMLGGAPTRAIDVTYRAISPRDTAQLILDELPSFPL